MGEMPDTVTLDTKAGKGKGRTTGEEAGEEARAGGKIEE
jgi:hypothetical protein